MSEIHQPQLSNLELSTETIVFSPDSFAGQLVISNKHASYSVCFKIKTKIEKIFEVKPARGMIKPGEKVEVSFKAFKKIEQGEKQNLEKNLQFLLQAVNCPSPEITKEEEETLWKQIKQKTANVQLGYCSVKLNINLSGDVTKSKQFIPSFANLSKADRESKYASIVRPNKNPTVSTLPARHLKFDNEGHIEKNEPDMSKKYEQLKKRQSTLIRQRQTILSGPTAGKPPAEGNKSIIILLILFALSFVLGNYLQTALRPQVEEPPEEEGFFSFL